jgi:hypothetical protein
MISRAKGPGKWFLKWVGHGGSSVPDITCCGTSWFQKRVHGRMYPVQIHRVSMESCRLDRYLGECCEFPESKSRD